MNYKKKKIILLSLMVLFSFFFSNKFLTKISLADFTTSVGTKWTYERSFFTTTAGRFGIEITNITQATGPILGTIYELGYAPQTDKQIDGYYIFNETTINNLILSNPTEERTYG
ncbi:MAG: hypothetical protein JW924_11570, partial [Fusobacteriaceae bacterium]|nr:hypothetical protein [Fusobacteriaceae bacterium]